MAFIIILLIALHLCTADIEILEPNRRPCASGNWPAPDRFNKRHLRPDTPNTTDIEEWSKFIKDINGCSRDVQTFLNSQERSKVDQVCAATGGKVYGQNSNLCISKTRFTFFEVRVNCNECKVFKVSNVTQHIILGCDKFREKCLPVHFQTNSNNMTPENSQKNCGSSLHENLWN